MDNPYEPPQSPIRLAVEVAPLPAPPTMTACLAAVVRCGVVTSLGLVAAGYGLVLLNPAPVPVTAAAELGPIGLGVAVGWLSLRRAQARAGANRGAGRE